MRGRRVTGALGVVGVLVGAGYGGEAVAQGGALLVGATRANFGVRSVTPGFAPDPQDIAVVSGGGVNARNLGLGPGCVGFVTRQPDVVIRLTAQAPTLRVYATAEDGTDITLLVNTAIGGWRCNDDSFGGTNPTVDLPNARPGQYDIWVGSYRQGQTARATLHITGSPAHHP